MYSYINIVYIYSKYKNEADFFVLIFNITRSCTTAALPAFFYIFLRNPLDKSECLVYSIAVCFIFIGNRKTKCPMAVGSGLMQKCPAKYKQGTLT